MQAEGAEHILIDMPEIFAFLSKAPGRARTVREELSAETVSADILPSIGTPLAVGKVVGKVIRHFEDGFAVRFKEVQDLDRLERMIVYDWSHEASAGAPPVLVVCDDEAAH
jgi:hypothetical protein